MRMVKRLRKDFLILIIGCFLALSFDVYSEVIIIAPSENSQERLQEALILQSLVILFSSLQAFMSLKTVS